MHITIGAIVVAKTKKEAVEMADSVFENLTGEHKPFDYHTTYKDEVYSLKTPAGANKVREMINGQFETFKHKLNRVREVLATCNDHEVFNERKDDGSSASGALSMVRHYFYNIGEYEGPSTYLYDHEGTGVRNYRQLERVIANYDHPFAKGEKLFLVLADVHY